MTSTETPPFLRLKLRSCDDLPDYPFNLARAPGARPSLLVHLVLAYDSRIVDMSQFAQIEVDIYGARRLFVMFSVEPDWRATCTSIEVRPIGRPVETPAPTIAVVEPLPPPPRYYRADHLDKALRAVQWMDAVTKLSSQFHKLRFHFDYGSSPSFSVRRPMALPDFKIEPIEFAEADMKKVDDDYFLAMLYSGLGIKDTFDTKDILNISDI